MQILTIVIVSALSFAGCALTPRGVSLRQREALYNGRLAQIHPGQTRTSIDSLFPSGSRASPLTTGMLNKPGPRFNPEYRKIDADFVLLVTFDYKHYRQVQDPTLVAEKVDRKMGIRWIGTVRIFPRGTKFYRLYPQRDDVVRSIARRVTRTDGDYIYTPQCGPINQAHH